MARVLGIDPGLNTSGYGVIETSRTGIRLIEAGIIRTKPKASLEYRLGDLHESLTEIVTTLQPDMMALEQLFSHYQRPQTAILMAHARGVICLCAQLAGIRVESFAPTRVKKLLTGSGRAPKSQMQLAVKMQLNLSTLPEPADVADALAIALCGYHLQKLVAA